MARTYELWLTTDAGVRIQQLDTTGGFSAARTANKIAPLDLTLPQSFDTKLLKPDRMVQVWRAPEGGRLGLWTVYFIRRWRFETKGSDERFKLWGRCPNDLLRRRIVAYYAGESESAMNDQADDMLKAIVTDSIADGTAPAPTAGTRVWSDLSIAGDLADGPTLEKGFAWKQLLTPAGGGIMGDIAKAAKEAGTEVFFAVVPKTVSATSITFEFRTSTGQPGMDVSDRVVFDQERGSNLNDPYLEYDYTKEQNYIYSAGQGDMDERNVQQVYDASRYNASAWNRCEGFADARNQAEDNEVREAGRAKLAEGRPVRRFGGVPMDTQGTRFGRDWDFGDKVRARYRGQEFDAIIRSVVLSMDDSGQETIRAKLEYED